MRIILILFLSCISLFVEARMYQWLESDVGTTQLSGKPPAWYRSESGGPRVFVFENGRLIDDTAVEVSNEVRRRMRKEAFLLVEKDRQKALEKMAKTEEMKNRMKDKNQIDSKLSNDGEVGSDEKAKFDIDLLTDTLFPKEDEDVTKEIDISSQKKLDELRAIITEWEASQTESAKQALE